MLTFATDASDFFLLRVEFCAEQPLEPDYFAYLWEPYQELDCLTFY